jgi:hypothetical protein
MQVGELVAAARGAFWLRILLHPRLGFANAANLSRRSERDQEVLWLGRVSLVVLRPARATQDRRDQHGRRTVTPGVASQCALTGSARSLFRHRRRLSAGGMSRAAAPPVHRPPWSDEAARRHQTSRSAGQTWDVTAQRQCGRRGIFAQFDSSGGVVSDSLRSMAWASACAWSVSWWTTSTPSGPPRRGWRIGPLTRVFDGPIRARGWYRC